jgi:hypothetical protein
VKRLLALVVLGALCAGAAGCDVSPTAATVNGITISRSQLDDQLSTVSGNSVAQCALTVEASQSGGTLPAVSGTGDATVSTQFAAFELNGLVEQTLEQSALARRHVTVSTADIAHARQDYEAQIGAAAAQSGSPCNLTGTRLTGALPQAFVDSQARALAYQEKLEEVLGHVDVSPAALRAYYDSHLIDVTQLCLNLIITTGQAAAQAVHDKIAFGTSFATASQGAGVDTTNTPSGGQGPCVFPANIVSQLGQAAAAAVVSLPDGGLAPPEGIPVPNQVTGQTSTVWIVIGVRQHHLVSFADSASGIRQALLGMGGARFTSAFARVVRVAQVELDPRYGTWSTARGVSAPTPPKPAYVLNPNVGAAAPSGPALGSLPGTRPTG